LALALALALAPNKNFMGLFLILLPKFSLPCMGKANKLNFGSLAHGLKLVLQSKITRLPPIDNYLLPMEEDNQSQGLIMALLGWILFDS
jgi:hypothetical protein